MSANTTVTEFDRLKIEAKKASTHAPKGVAVTVKQHPLAGHYDVYFGRLEVGYCLRRGEALACIRGAGGACLVLHRIAKAATAAQPIEVIDRFQSDWRKDFKTREEARAWIMEGMAGTEGAEQEHYTNMLIELESGKTTLHYN